MPGRRLAAALVCAVFAAGGCASGPDPMRYRLGHSGDHWDVSGVDHVFEDLEPRYPEFFALVLDPRHLDEPNLKTLRDDLERMPVGRRNFDALNAVAIAYFELNYRAESRRGGAAYLADSQRAAKLVAVPWRAYGLVSEARLRDAILDFFEDVATGSKLASAGTAPRLAAVVSSLERKEQDPARLERIRAIAARLAAPRPRKRGGSPPSR